MSLEYVSLYLQNNYFYTLFVEQIVYMFYSHRTAEYT